ncbi:MAG: YHS domain-containing (seleno)protein [Granulosicoccus sp.]
MNIAIRRFPAILLLAFAMLGSAIAAAPVNTLEKSGLLGRFKPSDVAIRGYDTVAYFTEGKPVEGSSEFTAEWQGANWQFSSAENQALFEANPEQYAPQYGGYCAYGVASGYLVKIEPENWTIVEDKLYLNYDSEVQAKWEKDIPGFLQQANQKFDGLLNE